MLRALPNSLFAEPAVPRTEEPAEQWLRWAVIQWKYPEGLTTTGKTKPVAEPLTVPYPREEETERTGT